MTTRFVFLAALVALAPGCIDTSGLVFGGPGGGGHGGGGAGTAGGGQGGDGGDGAAGGSTPSGDYAAVVLADDPLAYWPLDSFANELVTEDATGNGWDAYRSMGGPTVDLRQGQVGSAVALTEAEYLFVDPGHPFGFAGEAYTLEAWVKLEATMPGGGLWACHDPGQDAGYTTYVGLTNLSHKRYDGGGMSLSHDLTVGLVGDFVHVVMVFDGQNAQWFLDGDEGTVVQPTSISWSSQTAPFRLASASFDAGQILVVDEVAVYAGVLPDDRIAAHFDCGANGQCD